MWNDVAQLMAFYDSPLGQVARRMIRRRLRSLWPQVTGQTVAGLGYATPFLRPFMGEAARVIALMPSRQGVRRWPRHEPGLVALADEAHIPLPDRSIDRLLMVHALECTEQLRPMMREVWRVLADSGRLLVVTPNRRGIWARLERTPFGHGRPFTVTQLSRVMTETLFAPTAVDRALFMPPIRSRVLLQSAAAWEKIGHRWFTQFSGVIMIEARKDVFAPTGLAEVVRKPALSVVPQGAAIRAVGGALAARAGGWNPEAVRTPPAPEA
jgi:SAM-dependent methyltransferase